MKTESSLGPKLDAKDDFPKFGGGKGMRKDDRIGV